MPFKIDIVVKEGKDKGRTFHLESESQVFIGMKISDTVHGKDIQPELEGYEFIITGASDKTGSPALLEIEGTTTKRVLMKYGKGMKQRYPHGLRLRKRVHGNTLSTDIMQINLVVKNQGARLLSEIFSKPEKPEGEALEGKDEAVGKKAEEKVKEIKEEKEEQKEKPKE